MNKKIVRIAVIIVIVVLLLGGGLWWLFGTGRLVYNSSGRQTKPLVCDKTIVDRYNDATYYIVRAGSETPTMDEAAAKKLVSEIKSKKNIESDPTCQTILFWSAVHTADAQAAQDAYKAVNTLHGQGHFADSNLRANEPLFMYEEIVKGLQGARTPVDENVSQ